MKKYTVVGFINDPGAPVEVVPTSWLTEDNQCFFPERNDERNLESLIRNCLPHKNSWSMHSVKIYGKSNSFTKAMEIASKACELSTLERDTSEDENLNKKRKITVPIRFRESLKGNISTSKLPIIHRESSPLEEDESNSKRPIIYQESTSLNEDRNYQLPSPPSEIALGSPSCSSPVILKVSSRANESSSSSFLEETILEKVLKHLADIKNENRLIRKEIKNLKERIDIFLKVEENPKVVAAISEITEADNFENLPLKNQIDLENLENEITRDTIKATSLARFLCRGSGFRNINALICNILKRLLSRNIALLYSMEGRQSKKKFSDLNLCNVVIASVKMKYEGSDTLATCKQIGKVLAGAVDWEGHRAERKRKLEDE